MRDIIWAFYKDLTDHVRLCAHRSSCAQNYTVESFHSSCLNRVGKTTLNTLSEKLTLIYQLAFIYFVHFRWNKQQQDPLFHSLTARKTINFID